MNKIKIVAAIALFLISLTGCKKSKEELAKELEDQKKQAIEKAINSVYDFGGNGLAFLIDRNSIKDLHQMCFDFRPSKNRAIAKFYKHPTVYNLEVRKKSEFEYTLIYQKNEGTIKLLLEGDYPVKEGSMGFLTANVLLTLQGESAIVNERIGKLDLIYGSDSVARSRHGRFKTLEECEAQISADEELSETLRKQDGACEGPGC
ncbi:lipoprotein, tandem type [Leptospira interrogans]|uniref:lipoprotein, tandem type n=1 Tax=Leptospira interrogans TaxID=173 RepID=UPI0002D60B78|nr:lipoprotein, tandem type [Leptospira interrogans]